MTSLEDLSDLEHIWLTSRMVWSRKDDSEWPLFEDFLSGIAWRLRESWPFRYIEKKGDFFWLIFIGVLTPVAGGGLFRVGLKILIPTLRKRILLDAWFRARHPTPATGVSTPINLGWDFSTQIPHRFCVKKNLSRKSVEKNHSFFRCGETATSPATSCVILWHNVLKAHKVKTMVFEWPLFA